MAQQLTECDSCVIDLTKFGDSDSDDDTCSQSTNSGSSSERSSGASRTTITRSFVWADEDSDDDFDITSFSACSAGCGNQENISGASPPLVPCVPPGCNQPFRIGGVGQQWAMVAVSPSFVPCAQSACFTRPVQLVGAGSPVNQSANWAHSVQSQSLQADAEVHMSEAPADSRTTIVLKNLPADCTHEGLCKVLDDVGLAGLYNFIYVPFDFKKFIALRYGFVNFEQHEDAVKAIAMLDGFSGWVVDSEKACEAEWSGAQQGLHANIERYRNSPMMHSSVPEVYKPVLFEKGAAVEFPAPTVTVKPLKLRRSPQA